MTMSGLPRPIRALAAVALSLPPLLLLGGCATVSETGRSQVLLISPSEEARMGLSAFEKVKASETISKDQANAELVRKVGRRISRVARLPDAQWEFVLFEDSSPNAFALPGGKVGINTGILKITQNEAGLATVIGHEIAHAVARHGAERLSQGMLVQLGGSVLGVALGGESAVTRQVAQQAYGIGTQLGVMMPYSRVHELEADELGLLYMARAGYDPNEAIAFWQRFGDYNRKKGGKPPAFLSTHPVDAKRIAELQAMLPRAMVEYKRSKVAG
jgi:metalloendopeptidase OMA1, mitochondrial